MKPPRPANGQRWQRPSSDGTALPTLLRVEKCLPLGMLLVAYRQRSRTGRFYWGEPRKVTAVLLLREYTLVQPASRAA